MTDARRGGRRRPPFSPARRIAWPLVLGALLLPVPVGGAQPAVVSVTMREFMFQPTTIRLAAGQPVRLVLLNRGQLAHQFETAYLHAVPVRVAGDVLSVEAAGLDVTRLNPDGTARLEFIPQHRGRYVFACTIEGHREAGMAGALDVR